MIQWQKQISVWDNLLFYVFCIFVCISLKTIFGDFSNIYHLWTQSCVKWCHKIRPIGKIFLPIFILMTWKDAKLSHTDICLCHWITFWSYFITDRQLTFALVGGVILPPPPPLWFFEDNSKTKGSSVTKLGIPFHWSILHLLWNFCVGVTSGQVTRSSHVT